MCRFLLYKGRDEILLSKLILDPAHSILTQSYDSRLRLDTRRPHNGDGFGVGYYTDPKLGPEPCIFTSTIPAWNCINLERLASKTSSSLVFAHVRATTEGNLSDQNCHPFRHNSLMWMHNGGIGGWSFVKRRLAGSLGDRWFMGVQGSTDSEWAFALFLDTLEKMGVDPSKDAGTTGFGHTDLRKALLGTIKRINELTATVPTEHRAEAVSLLNFAVTDGHSVVCSRYVSSKHDEAASLFFSSGTSWQAPTRACDKGQYKMERRDRGADIVLVASEPLTFERGGTHVALLLYHADHPDNWVTVPNNSTVTIHKQTVLIHPIIDEFYSYEPCHQRSIQLASEKGQTTTKPASVSNPCGTESPLSNGAHQSGLADDIAFKLRQLATAEH